MKSCCSSGNSNSGEHVCRSDVRLAVGSSSDTPALQALLSDSSTSPALMAWDNALVQQAVRHVTRSTRNGVDDRASRFTSASAISFCPRITSPLISQIAPALRTAL